MTPSASGADLAKLLRKWKSMLTKATTVYPVTKFDDANEAVWSAARGLKD